jgi:hypothetical protein
VGRGRTRCPNRSIDCTPDTFVVGLNSNHPLDPLFGRIPTTESSEFHEKLRAYALKNDGAVEDASPQIGSVEIESVILSSAVAALATPARQRATNPWHENTSHPCHDRHDFRLLLGGA